MDLVEINNQVVNMRGIVRQAKVHVIRKLTRRMGMLRNRSGTEIEVAKNMKRADNMATVVMNIKKLNVDQLSKFALTNEKKLGSSSKGLTDNLRCMLRLADHKLVQKCVKKFRVKHPNWQKQIPTLLKMRDIRKQFKTNDKKSKSKPKRNNNINVRNEKKRIKKETPIQDSQTSTESTETKTEENGVKMADVELQPKMAETVEEKIVGETEIKVLKLDEMLKEKENVAKIIPEVVDIKMALEKTEKVVEIIQNVAVAEKENQNGDGLKTTEEEEVKLPSPRQKDPFFLDSGGDVPSMMNVHNEKLEIETDSAIPRYLSKEEKSKRLVNIPNKFGNNTKFNRRGIYELKNPNKFKPRGKQDLKNKKNFRPGQNGDFKNQNKFKRPQIQDKKPQNPIKPQINQDKKKDKNKIPVGVLHPSWEAKLKQKQQCSAKIVPQGKKIIFDD